jgi:hypothetical protein
MTAAGAVAADQRICATCAYWGQDLMWVVGAPTGLDAGNGLWPGHCARKDQRTGAIQGCQLWSAP